MKYFHIYGMAILFKKENGKTYSFSRRDDNGYKWNIYNIYKNRPIPITLEKFLKLDKVKRRMKSNHVFREAYTEFAKEAFYDDLLKDSDDV